ncbi:MAG: 2-hydroxyacyl-CoA dehydratase family protein [Candidatus Bathyarchaeia archaeon]
MNDIYKEFLIKCAGFGDPPFDEELDEILPKWKLAAKKLGLTEEDIKYAMNVWIPRNFDIKSEGVRKTIGAYLAEVVDLMMADEYKRKGCKLVYGVLPAHPPFYRALKFTDPTIQTYFPDAALTQFLGPFLHKIYPFLEEAEAHGMRYGCRHCALNKVRYAALRRGLIPMPDVSWIWGFVCDQAPKSDEFIKEIWNEKYPTIFSRIPHDQPAHKTEHEDEERVKYLASIMREGYEETCKRLGIDMDEKAIKDAFNERTSYLLKYSELATLEASDPPPVDGNIFSVFLANTFSIVFNTGYKYFNPALDATLKEAKERVKRGEGIVPKGSPRGMAWFLPAFNPFIARMFWENGVALVFGEGLLPSKADLQPPKFKDPFEMNAEALLKWSLVVNWGRKADLAIEKLETYRLDFMIWGFLDFDRWLGSDHRLCARYVEEKTGKPCFYIEGDIWEDRDYSEEVLRTRIETICEIIKARV